jgi:hypothetical protein
MLIDPNDPMMSAPAVPAGTLRRFTERLPELQALVSQALSIDARAGANGARPEQLGFILDLQPYIGLTLAAVYQFGIYGILAEEAADLARVCTGRGLDARFLVRMVQTWEIALHAALRTPDVSDLVRPLQWLESLV